jgi:hypothetical protein
MGRPIWWIPERKWDLPRVAGRTLDRLVSAFWDRFNATRDTMRADTIEALRALSEGCKGAFDKLGVNREQFATAAANFQFYDTREQWVANWFTNDVSGDRDLAVPRLKDLVQNAYAAVLRGPNAEVTNQIVLGPAFFQQPPAEQNLSLIHEGLHAFLGLDDPGLAKTLGLGNIQDGNVASAAIAGWLTLGCLPAQ